jgi:hypothetical protein
LLAASGGYAVGIYLTWKDTEVWELLETIEMVVELQAKDEDK